MNGSSSVQYDDGKTTLCISAADETIASVSISDEYTDSPILGFTASSGSTKSGGDITVMPSEELKPRKAEAARVSDVSEKVTPSSVTEELRIRKARKKVFPPILTSLNANGRRRFRLMTVREEGRLQILAVPNQFSEVVRTPHGGDRLSMELVDGGAYVFFSETNCEDAEVR